MTKFLIILLVLYFLYYIGNIVYDLFVKKESTLVTEEINVFSLVEFEEQNRDAVTTVGIEDVENLNTPKSFNKKEFPVDTEISEEREDIEVWRQRFESEQNIDSFDSGTLEFVGDDNNLDEVIGAERNEANLRDEAESEANQNLRKINNDRWFQMLNDAETTVQMISNTNGHKVYQAAGF
ncbi:MULTISPECIES: hypothetical protein [Chryseobacterium group]|uniref:Uncharacterized protein n=1 Tax=Chryseobacterium koreense CCUG 49689 TaxID=1304281 RepID=A0A0J7J2F9_9FLAO|nr:MULTISPECIES: hypothetical protein [Chryseobacterium group]KMQ72241.1 hypothetical protein ACM44_01970 [Chryseobacterium koreense CCUG 49689]MBB5334079.1 S-adenosylmethionine synthetase [Chryseobacterium koreense]